jgi:hypothetical protein
MWPFKSKIPNVERIFTEEDGELITIIHEKGAHKFRREEIIELLVISDNFSVFSSRLDSNEIHWWHRVEWNYTWLYLIWLVIYIFAYSAIKLLCLQLFSNSIFQPTISIMTIFLTIIFYSYSYLLLFNLCNNLGMSLFNEKVKDIILIKFNNSTIKLRINGHLREDITRHFKQVEY